MFTNQKIEYFIVLGTRPEAIKMAPLVMELRKRNPANVHVCATGQHAKMVDQALGIFGVAVDSNLHALKLGQSLSELSGSVLLGLDNLVAEMQPEWLLVQGDTLTAAMAGLCGFFRGVKVGHIEAGLRTGNIREPFPEEFDRRMLGLIATRHFAPTSHARNQLLREGVAADQIVVTGNTGIDALYFVRDLLDRRGGLQKAPNSGPIRVLITAHRRENQQGGISNICSVVRRVAHEWRDDVEFVWPVHPNPNVGSVVHKMLDDVAGVHLVEPLAYEEMVREQCLADLLVTDSGGLQEEGPALGKRVLVMRDTTERPEGVDVGVAELVGTDPLDLYRAITQSLQNKSGRVAEVSPYGDGLAAERIANSLMEIPFAEYADAPVEAAA